MPGKIVDPLSCPHCGAPMEPPQPTNLPMQVVTCTYCDHKVRFKQRAPAPVASTTKTRREIRVQWQVERYRAGPRRWFIFAIPLIVLVLLGGIGALTMYFVTRPVRRSTIPPSPPASTEQAAPQQAAQNPYADDDKLTLPVRCDGNKEMELRDKNFTSDRTLFYASDNCTLILRNSNLTSSRVAAEVSGNAKLIIEECNVTGKPAAIRLSGNASAHIGDSTVTGGGVGIEARGNSKVTLKNSNVTGDHQAIDTANLAKVDADDSNTLKP